MTVSLKIDENTPMGLVSDLKEALREAHALRINYVAVPRADGDPPGAE